MRMANILTAAFILVASNIYKRVSKCITGQRSAMHNKYTNNYFIHQLFYSSKKQIMKKFLMVVLIASMSTVSFGQTEGEIIIKGSKQVTKDSTPQQVIDTLKKRFPNAEAVQYYETSAATANGWAVDGNGHPAGDFEYYTIKFKRHDFQYYALFEANGTLVKSEFQQVNVELPEAVKASLLKLKAEKYPDYQLMTKNYFKYEDYDMHKDYYEITAAKTSDANQKKTIIVDASGKILKEK